MKTRGAMAKGKMYTDFWDTLYDLINILFLASSSILVTTTTQQVTEDPGKLLIFNFCKKKSILKSIGL